MKSLVRSAFQVSQDYYPETYVEAMFSFAPNLFTYSWYSLNQPSQHQLLLHLPRSLDLKAPSLFYSSVSFHNCHLITSWSLLCAGSAYHHPLPPPTTTTTTPISSTSLLYISLCHISLTRPSDPKAPASSIAMWVFIMTLYFYLHFANHVRS